MKIYLAGPLFTQGEQIFNRMIASDLEDHGHQVFLPQEAVEEGVDEPADIQRIFQGDVEGLDWADAVVAVLDGPDVDSGTAWEVGYAYANKKPIFGLRTDFRTLGEFEHVNVMIQATCEFIANTISELTFKIKSWTPPSSPTP